MTTNALRLLTAAAVTRRTVLHARSFQPAISVVKTYAQIVGSTGMRPRAAVMTVGSISALTAFLFVFVAHARESTVKTARALTMKARLTFVMIARKGAVGDLPRGFPDNDLVF